MDNALAKTKQAVSRYKSRSQSDSLNATKSVWAAVRFLRKQLPELERKDKGVTSRVARELTDVLGKLPMFRHIKDDKEVGEALSNKEQAEEHILKLENQLKTMVKELENSKIDEIKGWVENHAVLGQLTKTLTRKMPDSTYIFLFRQLKNNNIELVTSRAPDGRVFTRFRPREFFDVKKLYRLYNHRPPVGAAVVVDNELQDVIGTVPPAKENEDQLHVISSMSKEAASQPAKSFLSNNRVLRSLHELAKDRKVDKGAYILLFVDAEEQLDFDADDEELLASADVGEDAAGDVPGDESSGQESEEFGEEPTHESASAEETPSEPAAEVVSSEDSAPAAEEAPSHSGEPKAESTSAVSAGGADALGTAKEGDADLELPTASVEESSSATSVDSSLETSAETASQAAEVTSEPAPEQSLSDQSAALRSDAGDIGSSSQAEGSESGTDTTSDVADSTEHSSSQPSAESSSDGLQESGMQTACSEQAVEEPEAQSLSSDLAGEPESQSANSEDAWTGSEEAVEPDSQPSDSVDTDAEPSAAGAVQAPGEPEVEQVYTPVEILTRPGSDGGILTRFYANEFSDVRKVFESFAGKRTISGAAVIRGRELVQVVGNVPQATESKSQLDVLILESNHAADKPTRDFMVEHEILNSLHELASGHFSDPNARVLLFTEEEGRLSVLTPPPSPQRDERGRDNKSRDRRESHGHGARGRDDRGRNGRNQDDRRGGGRENDRGRETSGPAKSSPLSDFRYPRDIRNGYRNLTRVVGASVIGEQKSGGAVRKDVRRDDNRGSAGGGGGRDQRFSDRAPRTSKSVVLAAFGRTPLKENVLITEETMRRLGLDFFS